MKDAKAPLIGSVPWRAIMALAQLPAGQNVTTGVLAEELGVNSAGLTAKLRLALEMGYLKRTHENSVAYWALGEKRLPDEDPDEPQEHSRPAELVSSIFAYAASRAVPPFAVHCSTDGRVSIERNGRVLIELTPEERRTVVQVCLQGVGL